MKPALPALPAQKLAPADIDVEHLYHDDEDVQKASYEIRFDSGSKRTGTTNGTGKLQLTDVPLGTTRIRFMPDTRKYVTKTVADNPEHQPDLNDAGIGNLVQKYRGQA